MSQAGREMLGWLMVALVAWLPVLAIGQVQRSCGGEVVVALACDAPPSVEREGCPCCPGCEADRPAGDGGADDASSQRGPGLPVDRDADVPCCPCPGKGVPAPLALVRGASVLPEGAAVSGRADGSADRPASRALTPPMRPPIA